MEHSFRKARRECPAASTQLAAAAKHPFMHVFLPIAKQIETCIRVCPVLHL